MKSSNDSNGIFTHNHLVRKPTLRHLAKLAKWLCCVVSTYLYDLFGYILLSCHVRVSEWIYVKELLARNRRDISSKCKWQQQDSNPFPDIQVTIECRFTLKCVRDMMLTCSQIHGTDKYSQHSSMIWPVWINGWVFVYELSSCGTESRCCYLNFRF